MRQGNLELRAESINADAAWTWFGGIDANHRDFDFLRILGAGPGNIFQLPLGDYTRTDARLVDDSYAAFGQSVWRFGTARDWSLTAGLRTERAERADHDTEDVLAEVVNGKKPDARDAEVLKKFVKTFGDTALKQLHDSVKEGNSIRGGRLVRGEGGPKDDAIPARVDNVHEARLSDGEFVVPAEAVAAAGNGDHAAGAQKMQEMSNALQGIAPGQPMNVEQVG